MNYTICLDPYSLNFTPSELSGNGFAIYTDADNFTSPIAVNIPASSIFSPPLGNCSITLTNIPNNATQLLVVDQCDGLPPTTPGAPDAPSYTCCYALINLPEGCVPWCEECSITFDTFQTSSIGKLVAGELESSCGTITDYVIGWYLNGDYSSPALTTGFGSAAGPYQFGPHPLTGSGAVPVVGGSWEGIIHDVVINGTLYSSVSGSKGGTLIPFESCFGAIIVDPLTCDNGTASGKYSHQYNFNSQAVGTTPSPVSITYTLDSTTKYFAYTFLGLSVWDELEIKWISGDPNATSDPSLYSQPIYLEKLKIGNNVQDGIPFSLYESTYSLPGSYSSNNFDGQYSSVSNIWPKSTQNGGFFQRVLTLTTLETSSNPASPDFIEITISPNPSNNNTQWYAGFQCLNTFDCTDCYFDNWPDNLLKIWKIELDKQYGCDAQRLIMYRTSSCTANTTSDWMGRNIGVFGLPGISQPSINLIGSDPRLFFNGGFGAVYAPFNQSYIPLKGNTVCSENTQSPGFNCGPSSTGTITFDKTPGQIQLTFNLESDYIHYKNALLSQGGNLTTPIPCPAGSTSVDYYRYFIIRVPIQGANANCGDNTGQFETVFHINDYLNIQYVENPLSNFWSITIPQTAMVNCYPQNQPCDSCYDKIQQFVNAYNPNLLTVFSFTTNVGAKYQSPIGNKFLSKNVTGGTSGSYCSNAPNNTVYQLISNGEAQFYPWYGTHTIPFISSSNGWVNLPSLGAFIPCSDKTGSYPISYSHSHLGLCYAGTIQGLSVRFLNLTSSGFNYSLSTNDFEIYAESGYGSTGSLYATQNTTVIPCPDPSSSLIYSYIGGVATVHTSSHFWQGNNPILVIDP